MSRSRLRGLKMWGRGYQSCRTCLATCHRQKCTAHMGDLFVAYAMRFIGENLAIGRGTSIIERLCGRPDICFWNPFVSFTASQNDRQAIKALRSEQRRVGKECDSTCKSRWSPYH